jgi:DNA invertase Pin-like site-specific DNA recombinase
MAIAKQLQKKGAELKVIDQSIDTTTPEGRLMFNIIGSFAEFEHDIRKARQIDGIRKAKGIPFGRKPSLNEWQRQEMVSLKLEGNLSLGQIADRYPV